MRKLRRIRAEKGLTMDTLEERTGVSKRTISEIERGKRTPQALTLAKLAGALGVHIDELLEEEAPKGRAPLQFEEVEQRRFPLVEVWTTYMRRRARAWEGIFEEDRELGLGLFNDLGRAALWATQVAAEADMLLATVRDEVWASIEATFPPGTRSEQLDKLMEAVQVMDRTADKVCREVWETARAARTRTRTEDSELSRAREAAEKAASERRSVVKLLEERRAS